MDRDTGRSKGFALSKWEVMKKPKLRVAGVNGKEHDGPDAHRQRKHARVKTAAVAAAVAVVDAAVVVVAAGGGTVAAVVVAADAVTKLHADDACASL